jgi:hypothetical protein
MSLDNSYTTDAENSNIIEESEEDPIIDINVGG